MPVIIPQAKRGCANGHLMIFRTLPIVGYENVLVLGCNGSSEDPGEQSCPHNVINRIKEIAWSMGIGTDPDTHQE